MTETSYTFPDPYIPATIPDLGINCPKTDTEMTHLKKKNIDESILQNMRNKDVYESYMHKIYNIIVGQVDK